MQQVSQLLWVDGINMHSLLRVLIVQLLASSGQNQRMQEVVQLHVLKDSW
jgi:hypothetical protein